jgi:hypothetical protein
MVAKHEGDDYHPKRETFFLESQQRFRSSTRNFSNSTFFSFQEKFQVSL